MKTTLIIRLFLLLVSLFTFLPIAFAQDYTTWDLPEGAKARLGKGSITGDIVYSPDGTRLAVASRIGIWIYDAATGEELDLLTRYAGEVYSVSFSPNGQTLASGSWDTTIRLWDVMTGDHKKTLEGHGSSVRSVAFSPDGQTLASGSEDSTVLLWKIQSDDSLPVEPEGKHLTKWGFIKSTEVFQNYPNPFNPETWIPYQLAKPTDVSFSIHAADGKVVRTLKLGSMPVGRYQNKSRAAHWDGKNALGESVASGVYYYMLKAGDFTSTRKMLIRK